MYNEGYGALFVSVYVYPSVCYYVYCHYYAGRCNTIVIPTIFCCNDQIFDFSKTASLGTCTGIHGVGQCSYRSLVSCGICELRSENGFSRKSFARELTIET